VSIGGILLLPPEIMCIIISMMCEVHDNRMCVNCLLNASNGTLAMVKCFANQHKFKLPTNLDVWNRFVVSNNNTNWDTILFIQRLRSDFVLDKLVRPGSINAGNYNGHEKTLTVSESPTVTYVYQDVTPEAYNVFRFLLGTATDNETTDEYYQHYIQDDYIRCTAKKRK
jgi:hypothetical protein